MSEFEIFPGSGPPAERSDRDSPVDRTDQTGRVERVEPVGRAADSSWLAWGDDPDRPPLDPLPPVPAPAPVVSQQRDRSGGEELTVTNAEEAREAVAKLLEHRRRGEGKLIGLAGLPRHGKSEFAKQLRDHLSINVQEVEDYAKTYSGAVNLYYLPTRHRRDVLIDLAGEDFEKFGDPYSRINDITVMTRLLWPVLAQLDGIILFVSLPLLWSSWNMVGGTPGERLVPSEDDEKQTARLTEQMIRSIQTLLKYTLVAKQLKQIRRKRPGLDLPASVEEGVELPSRAVIDDAFTAGGPLSIPVFIAYSKSDLFRTPQLSDGLRTGPLTVGRNRTRQAVITPESADPLVLGALAFPELYRFLEQYVRYYKFDYVQVIHDGNPRPSAAAIAETARRQAYADLKGVLPAMEFLTEHPWGLTTPGTATTLKLDRRLNRSRWSEAFATLLGDRTPRAPQAAGVGEPAWTD
ncbi:MAG TPA: hypothetical protein VFS20_11545 [Longimicrobium sp.]|nr:hypothetical protein [Longimicrobium sp.]